MQSTTYLLAFSSEDRVAMIWGGSKNTTMELSVDFVLSMTGTSGGSGSGNKSELMIDNGCGLLTIPSCGSSYWDTLSSMSMLVF